MKQILVILLVSVLSSCNSSELSNDFNCNSKSYTNLTNFTDFKKNFTIKLPKKWKTNYYYDNVISSIYTADTTLSLTQSTLIDASFVLNTIALDKNFINKIKNDNLKAGLQEIKSNNIIFLKQPTYYNLSEGKKGKYSYKILNIFSKNNTGFLHIKTEVYGDSLADERICKAIKLIEKIKLN